MVRCGRAFGVCKKSTPVCHYSSTKFYTFSIERTTLLTSNKCIKYNSIPCRTRHAYWASGKSGVFYVESTDHTVLARGAFPDVQPTTSVVPPCPRTSIFNINNIYINYRLQVLDAFDSIELGHSLRKQARYDLFVLHDPHGHLLCFHLMWKHVL